ncbi:HpcH/HpaI aldolase/citrate lyase family protein [Paenibacillus sp. JTLBN-2024]
MFDFLSTTGGGTACGIFQFLSEARQHDIFFKRPVAMHLMTPRHVLAHALGATLYMPATRQDIADMLLSQKYEALCSVVFCLEDAIGDQESAPKPNFVTRRKITIEVFKFGGFRIR